MLLIPFCGLFYDWQYVRLNVDWQNDQWLNCMGFGRMWLCTNTETILSICLDRVMTATINLKQDCWCSAKIKNGHFLRISPQSLTTTPIFLISLLCMQMVYRVQWMTQSFPIYSQKCIQYCNCPISVCFRNPSTTDFRILWNIMILCWVFYILALYSPWHLFE
jgi:hypothetical protein